MSVGSTTPQTNEGLAVSETAAALSQQRHRLKVLQEIGVALGSVFDLEQLLRFVVERVSQVMNADRSTLYLVDSAAKELWSKIAEGDNLEEIRLPIGSGLAGWVAQHATSLRIDNAYDDRRFDGAWDQRSGFRTRSALCMAVKNQHGDILGVLQVLNQRSGVFSLEDEQLLEALSAQVAVAIENSRLFHSLAQKNQELVAIKEQLERKFQEQERRARDERLSLIGQFLSGVLHDLKTPMAVISGFVQMLVSENDVDKRFAYAKTVLRQVQLINTMTRETLAYARGDRTLWVRKVYLHKFFAELSEQLRIELAPRNVRLAVHIDDRRNAYFDEHKMERAIHNLARNAADAFDRRGGNFTIRVERDSSDDALVWHFEDNGPGVADNMRQRLFESFSTHGKAEGTGLGLAVVRKVVEDHGGTIECVSQPGRTVFSMRIPQVEAATAIDANDEATPSSDNGLLHDRQSRTGGAEG